MHCYLSGGMKVHRNIKALPPFEKAVITIGTFDGVHAGHQQILSSLTAEARKRNGESVIITFHPHPRKVVQPHTSLQLINTMEEKEELLRGKDIDHLVVVPFTPAFSELPPEKYISEFLIAHFHPHAIIIGYDHHFGKGRKGNYHLLEKMKSEYGYELIEIPQHLLNQIAISSTMIRDALIRGEVEKANSLLGYQFFFEGTVVHGDMLGRELNYPTANLEYNDGDKIHLAEGVYAIQCLVDKRLFNGLLSIGKRPTLNDTVEKVEAHLFGFNENIYGKVIRVIVKKFLRRQEKFPSLEALRKQMDLDKKAALQFLPHS